MARVEVVFNGVSFTAAVTYTLSLAPEYEQISMLSEQISKFEHGITNQVQDLTDITTGFRDSAMLRLNTLTGQVNSIDSGVSNLVHTIGDFSNTVVNPLATLTNNMVSVLVPSATNTQMMVSNIYENTSADQARILNRPTTVELGSTNTILYKTMGGIEFGRVTVSVSGVGTEYAMTEVSPGMGIYSYDIVSDWGVGSYTITCSDPNASDSMVLEVIAAGEGTLADMQNSIASMETNILAMSSVMNDLNNLKSVVDEINNTVSSGGTTATMISQLENLISGGGGTGTDSSLIGNIANLSKQIDDVYQESSDARQYSKNARDYSDQALKILKELKTDEVANNPEAVKTKLEELQTAVNKANTNISSIPKTIGASSLHDQMVQMAEQISAMAKREGLNYEMGSGAAGEGGAEGPDEESITDLNQNIQEMKISLKFMQRLLDEEANKPVVEEDWMGVE
jgi:hypothetical protein